MSHNKSSGCQPSRCVIIDRFRTMSPAMLVGKYTWQLLYDLFQWAPVWGTDPCPRHTTFLAHHHIMVTCLGLSCKPMSSSPTCIYPPYVLVSDATVQSVWFRGPFCQTMTCTMVWFNWEAELGSGILGNL